ncbi:hypothetical protein Acr_25g0000510 [Actinidia rufa]|uniref:ENTH domain-containing protein n=1 Tax=Actinidia rufa TaxID=165716 RepID=A0A7J0GXW0_9ERIC|nr:hypothetical protein Acr_25g0000510 [Actinidia rufa]
MQKRFRQAVTAIKEHGSVSYAKIATMGGFCDIDLIIVKATSPDDLPLPERYVHELLKIFSVSPSSFWTFSLGFTRRFGKTQCWRVALKCLVLLHRLLQLLPETSSFRAELLSTRSNGLMSLYPCHFKDTSSLSSNDYTLFIRSYAQLLDEALDCLPIDGYRIEDNEEEEEEEYENKEVPETLSGKVRVVGQLLKQLPQLQNLIDRVLDSQPTGAAARSFLVQSAMKHIIRDSFMYYISFRKEVVVLLDNLLQMPYRSCVSAFSIYKKAAVQAIELAEFYDWCKSMGLCGSYEYPFIDKIPQIQIQALENFLNGMWQLTDQSSSSTISPQTLTVDSPRCSTEGDSEKQLPRLEMVPSNRWAKFEDNASADKMGKGEEMGPLIQFDQEVNNSVSWEALLEASLSSSCLVTKNNLFFNLNGHVQGYVYGHKYGNNSGDGHCEGTNGWEMQIYNPYAQNPFYQQHNSSHHSGSFGSNPMYTWGL